MKFFTTKVRNQIPPKFTHSIPLSTQTHRFQHAGIKIKTRLVLKLKKYIKTREQHDHSIKQLNNMLHKPTPAAVDFSIEKTWRADKRLGRSTSYYSLEEEALHADLPRVAALHNRELVLKEIERRRREIAWETARNFWPLQTLPEEERCLVMYLAGALPPMNGNRKSEAPLPTDVARKYRLVIRNGNRRREYEPDPEIEKLMTETFASEEDIRLASLAEAGMLAAGQRMNICYGTSGGVTEW